MLGKQTAHRPEETPDMAIGFRILPRPRKVGPEAVAGFRELPVANVSDGMSRITAGGARLRPMHAGGLLAGPALTVKTRPGDNLSDGEDPSRRQPDGPQGHRARRARRRHRGGCR